MSNALAIATVTAVLKDLMNNGVIDHQLSGVVGEVAVSALPPDRVLVEGQAETSRINLFLYHVTPNQGWRNVALPSRDSDGNRIANPPLALDLEYLVTTYGASEFHGEILLGYALQLLHETPILTRDAIRTTLSPPAPVTGSILPPPLNALVDSGLADQFEEIRLTPRSMSVDEISKLWMAFQSHYRPSAAYQASVVLIESQRPARSALPVANDKRHIYVVPFRFPAIDRVVASTGERDPIAVGTTISIQGRGLEGDSSTIVNVDGFDFTPPSTDVTPDEVCVVLASPLPAGLHAGVKGVQVVQPEPMGDPAKDHRGFESNVAAFVLRPTIANGPVIAAGDVLDLQSSTTTVNGVTVQLRTGRLRVKADPAIGRSQRVTLLLNEFNVPSGTVSHAYSFEAPAHNGFADGVNESDTVEIPFVGVVAGTYLVRIRSDGAESVLAPDGSGVFATPRVAFP